MQCLGKLSVVASVVFNLLSAIFLVLYLRAKNGCCEKLLKYSGTLSLTFLIMCGLLLVILAATLVTYEHSYVYFYKTFK